MLTNQKPRNRLQTDRQTFQNTGPELSFRVLDKKSTFDILNENLKNHHTFWTRYYDLGKEIIPQDDDESMLWMRTIESTQRGYGYGFWG